MMFGHKLRYCKVSELAWLYDAQCEAWMVRHADTGEMLAYITREMVENVVFTPESVLAEWIWRVSRNCEDGSSENEPSLVSR